MRGQMTHLDTDVLAEFRAGLITGWRGARITAHLGGCERCTALDEQLAGVRSLLASLPAPTMPDSVAQRLDTVLAAEVAQRNATAREAAPRHEAAPTDQAERAGGDGTRESSAPRRPGGNRGFRPLALRVLAPAAAVVVLAAGAFGLTRINLGSSTGSAASTSAGGAVRSLPNATAGAESAGHVNAPAAGPGAVPRGIARAGFSLVTGQRNLTRANLAQQVRDELLVPPSARHTQTPTPQLRGCVARLADGLTLELVERVLFEGRPATLVVARTGAEDTVWIAAPDCSDTNPHVLATATLPSGISGP